MAVRWAREKERALVVRSPVVFCSSGRNVDGLAGSGRLDDGLGHAEVLEAVSPADERFGLATYHGRKMLDLKCERIGALKRDRLSVKGLCHERSCFF